MKQGTCETIKLLISITFMDETKCLIRFIHVMFVFNTIFLIF